VTLLGAELFSTPVDLSTTFVALQLIVAYLFSNIQQAVSTAQVG
jgi:hypothetical protein